jgi:hypothetical protein
LGGGLFLLLINLWLLFLQAIKDGKFIEEDISKYQEDVYFFKVKNPDNTVALQLLSFSPNE